MKTFATSALFAALAIQAFACADAGAMTLADLGAGPATASSAIATSGFLFGDELLPGRNLGLSRLDTEAARAAAEAYYDFDALLEIGVVALAGGALAALGAALARRDEGGRKPAVATNWRETTLRTLERDLARFAGRLRRAA